MSKLLQVGVWITLFTAMGIMLLLLYWMLYPYKVIEFKNLPFPVLNENKIVTRGTWLNYKMVYCKYSDEIPEVKKFITDGVLYEIVNTVGVATKGCNETISQAYISKNIPAGDYSLTIIATYKVNPVRNIIIHNYTEKFTVK